VKKFKFTTVSTIINESGGVSRIGEILSPLGYKKVLAIADKGIVNAGLFDKLIKGLNDSEIINITFTDIGPDPTENMVWASVSVAKENSVDCIVGIGGGSVMDVAKLTAVLAKNDYALADIYGIEQVRGGRLPLVLIPTTAGTGSEVTSSSVISHESGKKNVVIDSTLYPDIALLDVEMLSSMPKHIVSTTGVDAIVHAIEAYTSATKKNPISDMLACEALRYLLGNIEESFQASATAESRSKMLLGSTLAGQAFTNSSVAAVHAFAYALAETFHLPHGLSNSLVLVHILKFNIGKGAKLYSELSRNLFPEVSGKSDQEAAEYLVARLEVIIEAVELNKGLREFDIHEDDLEKLAKLTSQQERLLNNNPCKIDYADALQIFKNAF